MERPNSPKSVKARFSRLSRELRRAYCDAAYNPLELASDVPLSTIVGPPFEQDLSNLLKRCGAELLDSLIAERMPGSKDSLTPSSSDTLRLLRHQVFPFVVKVWEDTEGLSQKYLGNYADLESELLRDLWSALVKTALQTYHPAETDIDESPRNQYSDDIPREPISRKHTARYPNRAAWLKEQLKVRGWNKHRVQEFSGPNHKTVQKILDGKWVQEGVLERLVTALEQKGGSTTPIPRD